MPQGSDFYQRQLRKDQRERVSAERAFDEIEKLEKRVKDLERQVLKLTNRLDVALGKGRKLTL